MKEGLTHRVSIMRRRRISSQLRWWNAEEFVRFCYAHGTSAGLIDATGSCVRSMFMISAAVVTNRYRNAR